MNIEKEIDEHISVKLLKEIKKLELELKKRDDRIKELERKIINMATGAKV